MIPHMPALKEKCWGIQSRLRTCGTVNCERFAAIHALCAKTIQSIDEVESGYRVVSDLDNAEAQLSAVEAELAPVANACAPLKVTVTEPKPANCTFDRLATSGHSAEHFEITGIHHEGKRLLLDNCGIVDSQIPAILAYVHDHPEIECIALRDNWICDLGAQVIATELTTSPVKYLDISNNELSHVGIAALRGAEMLRDNLVVDC